MLSHSQNSVVVIPTAKRPEFLALTLERLAQAGADHLDVRIFPDWGFKGLLEDVEYCRDTYLPTAEIFAAGPHPPALSGCWNILNSLRAGYETGKEFIFHVEEDVFVAPRFFDWHWAAQESDDYFVTCGRRHRRMPADFFSNPGTCYRRKSLALIVPHVNDEYFSNTEKYVDKHWPQYRGMDGSLDDGMIRKIQRSVNGKVLCAEPRVCSHMGFHYYNRIDSYINNGKTIQERIAVLREMLPRIDPQDRYTPDIEPLEVA